MHQVDLRDDGRRAADKHRLGTVFLDASQPVYPVAHPARVDTVDVRQVEHQRPATELGLQRGQLVVFVDHSTQLKVCHAFAGR